MKLRVFNSLFDEKVFFKLPVKVWKYIVFLFIILSAPASRRRIACDDV